MRLGKQTNKSVLGLRRMYHVCHPGALQRLCLRNTVPDVRGNGFKYLNLQSIVFFFLRIIILLSLVSSPKATCDSNRVKLKVQEDSLFQFFCF